MKPTPKKQIQPSKPTAEEIEAQREKAAEIFFASPKQYRLSKKGEELRKRLWNNDTLNPETGELIGTEVERFVDQLAIRIAAEEKDNVPLYAVDGVHFDTEAKAEAYRKESNSKSEIVVSDAREIVKKNVDEVCVGDDESGEKYARFLIGAIDGHYTFRKRIQEAVE